MTPTFDKICEDILNENNVDEKSKGLWHNMNKAKKRGNNAVNAVFRVLNLSIIGPPINKPIIEKIPKNKKPFPIIIKLHPFSLIESTISFKRSVLREANVTLAPAEARATEHPKPIPLLAPTTTALFPSRRNEGVLGNLINQKPHHMEYLSLHTFLF